MGEREYDDDRPPQVRDEDTDAGRPGPIRKVRPAPNMDGWRVLRELRSRLFGTD